MGPCENVRGLSAAPLKRNGIERRTALEAGKLVFGPLQQPAISLEVLTRLLEARLHRPAATLPNAVAWQHLTPHCY